MKLLLLEDHPLFRGALRSTVEQTFPDCTVHECENTKEAKTVIDTQPLDFVIADLGLMNENSFDLIQWVSKTRPSVPVLVLSMHEDPEMVNRAMKAGARGYVSKRESASELEQAIKALLADDRYLSPAASSALVSSLHSAAQTQPDEIDVKAKLTPREFEIFTMLGRELSRKEIAGNLNITVPTVDTHLERIKRKLDLESTHKLLCLAIKSAS